MSSERLADLADQFECFGIAREYLKFPKTALTCKGTLVVLGGGRCVWDDLAAFGMAGNHNHDVMCVNDIVMHYPGPVKHVYSNDHGMLSKWVSARRPTHITAYYPVQHTHTCRSGGAQNIWPWPGHGSSGLNAVYTGLGLGYERIVICGIPLDNSGHYFDPPWTRTNFMNEVADRDGEPKYWANAAKRIFKGRVKSMSGRTKDLLGAP